MSKSIMTVECKEPEGTFMREVRFAPLTAERLHQLWIRLSQFPMLFNRHIVDEADFITTFVSEDSSGNLRSNGLIWEVDDVGIIYLTEIYPAYQATGHYTFWDGRFKGREELIQEMLKYAFKSYGFQRIIAEIGMFAQPALKAVERIGFTKEGRLREAAWYQGEWWDVALYSILKRESVGNGISQA